MATFVAVHGAFFGGWAWKPLAALMESRGHRFLRPTLTGCAEREHVGGPHVNLTTHIQDIVSLVEMEELEEVFLLGHSYAGLVIAGAAQKLHRRLAGLIHLDAFLPFDGERGRDYFDEAVLNRAEMLAAADGDGWLVPFFMPMKRFCADSDPARPWLAAQLRGMPLNPLSQRIHLPRDVTDLPMLFVYCKAEAIGMFETSRDRARQRPNTEVIEVDLRHALMVTHAEKTADMLHAFSQRVLRELQGTRS